jgi:hypothetical protein
LAGVRDLSLRALVGLGVSTVLITEILSAFGQLSRGPLLVAWAATAAAVGFRFRAYRLPYPSKPPFTAVAIGTVIGLIVALTGVTAALSPPNTFDALAYHLPRVVYWAQAGSVDFFPTSYLNQISLPPAAEYMILHTYIATGGDHFVNLISSVAFAACIVGVSAVAEAMGASTGAQLFTALFCATLPGAILQASGPKNDILLALWLVCAIYFVLRGEAVFAGLAIALAVATKTTAYLFIPPLIAIHLRRTGALRILAATGVGVLLLNGPHYWRNLQFSGSVLGYESPFGNNAFLYRNAHLGWKSTVSNLLRHTSEQLGGSEQWNRQVYDTVVRAHAWFRLDPDDPGSTWQWTRYAPPANTRHESNANNRLHLLLLTAAMLHAAWRGLKFREFKWLIYGAALVAGFVLFCLYLRWQPYAARLFVPLFIAAAPLAGFFLDKIRLRVLAIAICLLLLDTARLPLLQNWIRPLTGPGNVFVTSRESRYFADIRHLGNEQAYLDGVEKIKNSVCEEVGIDVNRSQLEYPFQALVLANNPRVRFQHVRVNNTSARYRGPRTPEPCSFFVIP